MTIPRGYDSRVRYVYCLYMLYFLLWFCIDSNRLAYFIPDWSNGTVCVYNAKTSGLGYIGHNSDVLQ